METASREGARVEAVAGRPEVLDVAYLEVDMSSEGTSGCSACESAKTRLRAALELAEPVLEELGVEVRVREELVRTEERARELKFKASPTIRVGDVELVPGHRAANGEAASQDGEDRAWAWRGEEHALPPKAMILDAVLRAYARDGEESVPTPEYEMPGYVARFLRRDGKAGAKAGGAGGCCG